MLQIVFKHVCVGTETYLFVLFIYRIYWVLFMYIHFISYSVFAVKLLRKQYKLWKVLNKLELNPVAQLIEHCIGSAKVLGLIPREWISL